MMPASPIALLQDWLRRQLPAAAASWLDGQADRVGVAAEERHLYMAISQVSRRLAKDALRLSPLDLAAAENARPGWRPQHWSLDQAARILLLLAAGGTPERFAERLDMLCATAEIGELVSFYKGLPLYPASEQLRARAAEGARSNIAPVFCAVAHDNPYPAEHFLESGWNHLVLKALFIGVTLHPIEMLDRRANPELARMLLDYAHERWAAGRTVSPELWRCVGRFADGAGIDDLHRALASDDEWQRGAAALALADNPSPRAAALLATVPDLAAALRDRRLSWETFIPPG